MTPKSILLGAKRFFTIRENVTLYYILFIVLDRHKKVSF